MKKILISALLLLAVVMSICAVGSFAENDITANLLYRKAPIYPDGDQNNNVDSATDGNKTVGNLGNLLIHLSDKKGSFYYDLGGVYKFTELIHTHDCGHVAVGKNERIDVVISVSDDANIWTEAGTITVEPQADGNRYPEYTVDLSGKTGRYLRYDVALTNPAGKEPHFQVQEIELYGTPYSCDHLETETIEAVAPTCSSEGSTEGKKCKECGHLVVEPEKTDKLPHTEETIPAQGSYLEGKKCSVCGEITVEPRINSLIAGKTPTVTLGTEQGSNVNATNGVLTDLGNMAIHLNNTDLKGSFYYDLGIKIDFGKLIHTHRLDHVKSGENERIAVVISVSDNAEAWTEVATFTVLPEISEYTVDLSGKSGRYIKYDVTLTNSTGKEPHFQVAEIELTGNCTVCSDVNAVVTIPGKAPTCTESGLTDEKKCSVCNKTVSTQIELAPTGHTEAIIPAVAPTCTEKGSTEGKKCGVCNEILTAPSELEASGHTIVDIPEKAPTCTEAGHELGGRCSVCEEDIFGFKEIPAKGHTEVEADDGSVTCSECGETVKDAPQMGDEAVYAVIFATAALLGIAVVSTKKIRI